MTDISVAIAHTEALLLEVAKQATVLAVGLQNAAPGHKTETPNKSVQYLFEIAERLNELAAQCQKMVALSSQEQITKLHDIILQAVQQDKDIREKYLVGDKFRFIRDRIQLSCTNIEEILNNLKIETAKHETTLSEDEVYAYVYLFNAQGITLTTWQKMVSPSIFYEHSVNRPIYTSKEHIEAFINRKPTKTQHAYITVTIKKHEIFKTEGSETLKDMYDHPLIRVKEGSLRFNKFVMFTHNGQDYVLTEAGMLVKKE